MDSLAAYNAFRIALQPHFAEALKWHAAHPDKPAGLLLHPADARDPQKVALAQAVFQFLKAADAPSTSQQAKAIVDELANVTRFYLEVEDRRAVSPVFTAWVNAMQAQPAIQTVAAIVALVTFGVGRLDGQLNQELSERGVKFKLESRVRLELDAGTVEVVPVFSLGNKRVEMSEIVVPTRMSIVGAVVTFERQRSFLDYQLRKIHKHLQGEVELFIHRELPAQYAMDVQRVSKVSGGT